MPKGFAVPRSPLGRAAINPPPPWHYSSEVIGVDFWADPVATAALLPEGLSPDPATNGHARVLFSDSQFTAQDDEFLDPARYQFREVRVLIDAVWGETAVTYCPFSFADNDAALSRGWMQGLPTKLGQIAQTRSYAAWSEAAAPVSPGGRFAASASAHGCRLIDVSVTLDRREEDGRSFFERPTALLRYVPQLVAGQQHRPAMHELTLLLVENVRTVDMWIGHGFLSLPEVRGEELDALRPLRMNFGFRCGMAYSVEDLRVLQDLRD
ncbi:acetoacetate decarboxylase family protein [Variovorax sp. Sphag1AA]|uniref:acetoacetate decarboxylase family protein n=1 Tax=Variovorax sp. Sphag1AA TaxID=2587027 RepID=UPI00160D540A|nr:acetoacetate decarboxylase family protein [Variovorax sp. Sphag1AA]MBB3178764.1 acetoacetate decarboxylase [Variovorax sp. Sphag1AA]